ncbi:MAG: phosphoribosylamine--glycine ligase [Polyangiales bacterium]
MRVLGIGHHNALGDLYLRLLERGHEVRVYMSDAEAHDILAGLVPRCDDYRAELAWVRAAGDDGIVLFECTGYGALQDTLRAEGYRVVGGSALGDRLELDRAYGQSVARALGMSTAATHAFAGFDAALAFLDASPGRYVLKFDGDEFAKTRNYVGVLDDGEDMRVMLRMQRAQWLHSETPSIVLMEHLSGVEVGVGGFFDGARFLRPVNLDWEHKRFFPGNLGELTGEMGTLVTYRDGDRLFDATLGRLAPQLAASGYVGYINLNLIVNERGAFPLEFTCRLGVPGFAILSALHVDPWDRLLARLVTRDAPELATHPGYAVGVVLTVPPFPYADGYERLSKGMPIGISRIAIADRARLHFGEVRAEGDLLVTAGSIGYVMVVTGRGANVGAAREHCYALAAQVIVPNVRYRRDIGEAFEQRDHAELMRLGWLDAPR